MTLSESALTKLASYPAESRAVWYLNDQSRRDRLAGQAAGEGSFTITAAMAPESENQVNVTMTASLTQGKLLGYEIRRGGKAVAFVFPGEDGSAVYTDTIGSANHRTYIYQAVAYDTLGNQIGQPVSSGEIRIAYDKTLDPASYTVSRTGDSVTFTLTEATDVSGLKLTEIPAAGDYTITVTTQDGKTYTARSGNFGQGNQAVDTAGSYLTYFQKPGAGAEDTRIWTYCAASVTVTGIPETLESSKLLLVSYAGDDIAFLEDGAAGLLSADYRYGEEEADVIPAGTLVVVGTYRGDPRFCTVKILGQFTRTTAEGEELEPVERPLDGYALLFAEVPEDGAVSDISDGLFLFVPDVQREAELQDQSHCDGVNLLPSRIKAVLSRTDSASDASSQRVTAETLWINSPGGTELPTIVLEG